MDTVMKCRDGWTPTTTEGANWNATPSIQTGHEFGGKWSVVNGIGGGVRGGWYGDGNCGGFPDTFTITTTITIAFTITRLLLPVWFVTEGIFFACQ